MFNCVRIIKEAERIQLCERIAEKNFSRLWL